MTQRQQRMASRHSRYDLINAGRALPLLGICRQSRSACSLQERGHSAGTANRFPWMSGGEAKLARMALPWRTVPAACLPPISGGGGVGGCVQFVFLFSVLPSGSIAARDG